MGRGGSGRTQSANTVPGCALAATLTLSSAPQRRYPNAVLPRVLYCTSRTPYQLASVQRHQMVREKPSRTYLVCGARSLQCKSLPFKVHKEVFQWGVSSRRVKTLNRPGGASRLAEYMVGYTVRNSQKISRTARTMQLPFMDVQNSLWESSHLGRDGSRKSVAMVREYIIRRLLLGELSIFLSGGRAAGLGRSRFTRTGARNNPTCVWTH